MRVLLLNPEFPDSYWSGRFALPFAGRRSLLPPLGLLTIAALLPRHWSYRLVDLNVRRLTDSEIRWADVVMLTGMIVQRRSLHELLGRCRRLGVRTVVGGPYATAVPGDFEQADHIVIGEAEDLAPDLAADLEARKAKPIYRESGKPGLTDAPVPRYDLIRPGDYHQMAVQYSRGCPFNCEFCDIIVMYGRKPRMKTPEQIVGELEAIRSTGFAGDVFFVDDNFIGSRKAVRELLPEIAAWRRRTEAPLGFYTEASMNLADDGALVDLMTDAGFSAVFIGIETPSEEGLRETRKVQNLKRDMVDQVHGLMSRGLDVWAGFILGFDSDGPDIFDRMSGFIHRAAIPYAMVGMLTALPNTPLYHRLEKAGRLRPDVKGDQFGVSNVRTLMPTRKMIAGYRRVLEGLYHPEAFFERCRENLRRWTPAPGSLRPMLPRDLLSGLRAMGGQGILGPYKGSYWRFLRWVLENQASKLPRALAQAAAGHHYITYTRKIVLPALEFCHPSLRRSATVTAS